MRHLISYYPLGNIVKTYLPLKHLTTHQGWLKKSSHKSQIAAKLLTGLFPSLGSIFLK